MCIRDRFSSGRDRRKLNRAAESARDGEITLQEAKQLRGIAQFENLAKETILQNALGKDSAGILREARDQLNASKASAREINVNVQQTKAKLEVAITESEENIKNLAESIADQIGPLIDSKQRNQQIIDRVIAAIKESQNASNP